MNDTFDIGVALAIGFVVGTYFGVWLLGAFRAYLVMHSSSTHSWQLPPEPTRRPEKTVPEFAGSAGFQALAESCAGDSGIQGEEMPSPKISETAPGSKESKEVPEVVKSR